MQTRLAHERDKASSHRLMKVKPSIREMKSRRHSYVASVTELLKSARKEAKGESRNIKTIASDLSKNLVTSIMSP